MLRRLKTNGLRASAFSPERWAAIIVSKATLTDVGGRP